jgi:uncharacterized protein (TIGR02271 family)
MTDETIVAVYDSVEQADRAVRDLEAAGIPSSAITQHSSNRGATSSTATAPVHEKGFWASLFGDEDRYETHVYNRSMESGSTVVTVRASEEHLTQAMDILEQHNPVDIDERATSYGLGAGRTTDTAAASIATDDAHVGGTQTGDEVIPLAEEKLAVGKRLVNRGTTRVRRFVVETPVEEAVTLHSERVSVERRPATSGAPVADADFADRTIEVTETDEEAVVEKTTRVREEVVVNKAARDRVETVRDTVRRQEVEVTRDGKAAESDATPPLSPKSRLGG